MPMPSASDPSNWGWTIVDGGAGGPGRKQHRHVAAVFTLEIAKAAKAAKAATGSLAAVFSAWRKRTPEWQPASRS